MYNLTRRGKPLNVADNVMMKVTIFKSKEDAVFLFPKTWKVNNNFITKNIHKKCARFIIKIINFDSRIKFYDGTHIGAFMIYDQFSCTRET